MTPVNTPRKLFRRCVILVLLLASIYAHAASEGAIERDPAKAAEIEGVASLLYVNGGVLGFLLFIFLKPFVTRKKKSG